MADIYCTACYTSEEYYPFGFCKKCWIKHGRPPPMKTTEEE